jgi:hypothetical protein
MSEIQEQLQKNIGFVIRKSGNTLCFFVLAFLGAESMCRQKCALEKVLFRYHLNRFGTKKLKKAVNKNNSIIYNQMGKVYATITQKQLNI